MRSDWRWSTASPGRKYWAQFAPGSNLTAASGVLFRIVRGDGATNLYCGRESYARHHLCAITAGMTRVINRETWKRRRLNDLHSTG
jgi:hypothetical protein